MTLPIKVEEGPFGLRNVDVYTPDERGGYKKPFRLAALPNSTYVRVIDARNKCVADAYLGHREAPEQAAQWLLDFACVTADGQTPS